MKKPTCGYKLIDGKVQAKVFDGDLPKGWADTPAKLKTKPKAAKNDDGE